MYSTATLWPHFPCVLLPSVPAICPHHGRWGGALLVAPAWPWLAGRDHLWSNKNVKLHYIHTQDPGQQTRWETQHMHQAPQLPHSQYLEISLPRPHAGNILESVCMEGAQFKINVNPWWRGNVSQRNSSPPLNLYFTEWSQQQAQVST